MTHKQALEKLELEAGATTSEITIQYQEFYNEFQMRITNAPTEHQRALYKKKLDELTLAFETLGGQQATESTEELPGIAESLTEKTEPKVAAPVADKSKMTKEKALQVLGLSEKFTEKELNNALKAKVDEFEKGKDNAVNTAIREGYEEAMLECNAARTLLKAFVFVPVIKPAPKLTVASIKPVAAITQGKPTSKRKWILPVSIVCGVGIIVLLVVMNMNGKSANENDSIDPTSNVEYIKLKSNADLLAEMGNWEEALTKYEKAWIIVETAEVKDSIESMQNHMTLASNEIMDSIASAKLNPLKMKDEPIVEVNTKDENKIKTVSTPKVPFDFERLKLEINATKTLNKDDKVLIIRVLGLTSPPRQEQEFVNMCGTYRELDEIRKRVFL